MSELDDLIKELEPGRGIRFRRLMGICEGLFGEARGKGSHNVFSTGQAEYPLINLQSDKGSAKGYQVKQVLKVLRLLKSQEEEKKALEKESEEKEKGKEQKEEGESKEEKEKEGEENE